MKMPLKCLKCGDTYEISLEAMEEIGYTRYSYCENCLHEAIKSYIPTPKEMYVLVQSLGKAQITKEGKVMAWKNKANAEAALEDWKRLLKKNGFGGWCAYVFMKSFIPIGGKYTDGRELELKD